MAQVEVYVHAVNDDGKSTAFKVRSNNPNAKLPKQFVLRLDPDEYSDGSPGISVGNRNLGINSLHRVEWLNERLEGYRRKQGDIEYIIAEVDVVDMPLVQSLAKQETY